MSASLAGVELLGTGREADTFAWGEDRVLRLLKNPAYVERLERERHAVAAARGAGVPAPAVFGGETVDGRPGLIVERIDGPDHLSLLSERPWLLLGIARALGETHARVNSVTASDGLPTVHEMLSDLLQTSELVPDEMRGPALERLRKLPRLDGLCHWDFHPANLIATTAGPVVIDWSFAARGDPAADVARTRMIISLGEPPTGATVVGKRLDAFGRRVLDRRYLSAYRRVAPVDGSRVAGWRPVVAVARLAAGIPEERPRLLALVGALLA